MNARMGGAEAIEEADRLFKALLESGNPDTARLVLRALIRADAGVAEQHDAAIRAVALATGAVTGAEKLDALGIWTTAHAMLASHADGLTLEEPATR